MSPQRPPARTRLARRTSIVLGVPAAFVALAAPAGADVPEGWSEPDPVNVMHAILVLGLLPLGIFLVITLLTYLPALMRGERVNPTTSTPEDQWLGGRRTTHELAAPDSAESQAGGASARW